MLSTPFPETILCDGHSSASGTTAFATCKSLHLNFCRVLPKVSFRYLLVEDKQGRFAVKTPLKQLTAKSAKNANMTQRVELRTLPKICKCHLDKFRDHPGNTAARVRRGRGDSIQVADSEAPAKS